MRSTFAVSLLSAVATRVQCVDLEAYRVQPATSYIKASDITTAEAHLQQRGTDYVAVAKAFVKTVAPNTTFRVVDDHYVSTHGIAHVYFKQTANGVDIDNAAVNINVSRRHLCREQFFAKLCKAQK
jgi:extracellular elastinolytic metalloproteinase